MGQVGQMPASDSTRSYLRQQLRNAVTGTVCAQVWLGYGATLFLGLGRSTVVDTPHGWRHGMPPYEIQTECADWTLVEDGAEIARSADERSAAEMALRCLVGLPVTGCDLGAGCGRIAIHFSERLTVEIAAWSRLECESPAGDIDAWRLRTPTGEHVHIWCSGKISVTAPDPPQRAQGS